MIAYGISRSLPLYDGTKPRVRLTSRPSALFKRSTACDGSSVGGYSSLWDRRGGNHWHRSAAHHENVASLTSTPSCGASEVVDVVVLGAGAAGLSAAYWAAQRANGASVMVLEKMEEAGKKILISGGTRCNVLPAEDPDVDEDFFTESSRSAARACFRQWSHEECKLWLVNDIGIDLSEEKESQKLFPSSNDAKTVRDALVEACRRQGVRMRYGMDVVSLRRIPVEKSYQTSKGSEAREHAESNSEERSDVLPESHLDRSGVAHGGIWEITTKRGERVWALRVVMATGGKSFPALGTTGEGWRILEELGHSLHPPYAALTPMRGIHPGGDCSLAGISLYDAEVSVDLATSKGKKQKQKQKRKLSKSQRKSLLMTHRGFSGPAILDISHYFTMAERPKSLTALQKQARDAGSPGVERRLYPVLKVSWKHSISKDGWNSILNASSVERGSSAVTTVLRHQGVPARLCGVLCAEAGLPKGRIVAELRKEERSALLELLVASRLEVTGHEGYLKAEVTGGGVPLNELNCSTMESRVAPALHICGELCDVHGRIGGFNFYFAWVTGRNAGLGAADALMQR